MMRAAELMATPGRYRQMVEEMRLTIEATPRATTAQPSENVTVEDVARLLAADGVTIPQVMDAFEWGHSMLMNLASSMDALRRTEAMTALANAQQGTSQDEQDRPRPIEPRWWYPPQWIERTAEVPPNTSNTQHTRPTYATIVPTAPVFQAPTVPRVAAPEGAQIPPSATAVVYDGWTGTQTIYLHPKTKRRKPRSRKKEDTDESSDVDDGGWTRQREANLANLSQDQQRVPEGTQEEGEPSDKMDENEDKDEVME
jgi:hypothetical protein